MAAQPAEGYGRMAAVGLQNPDVIRMHLDQSANRLMQTRVVDPATNWLVRGLENAGEGIVFSRGLLALLFSFSRFVSRVFSRFVCRRICCVSGFAGGNLLSRLCHGFIGGRLTRRSLAEQIVYSSWLRRRNGLGIFTTHGDKRRLRVVADRPSRRAESVRRADSVIGDPGPPIRAGRNTA